MTDTIEVLAADVKSVKHDVIDRLPSIERTRFPDSVVFVDFTFPEKSAFEPSVLDPKDFVEVSVIGKSHVVIVASNVVVGPQSIVSAPVQYLDKLARDHGAKIVGSSKSDEGGRFDFGTVTRLYAIEKV